MIDPSKHSRIALSTEPVSASDSPQYLLACPYCGHGLNFAYRNRVAVEYISGKCSHVSSLGADGDLLMVAFVRS